MVTLSVAAILTATPDKAMAQSVICPQPMNFGEVITCAAGGTVKITPGEVRTPGGCVMVTGAPYSMARCVVTQAFPYKAVQISVTAATYTINNGGGKNMSVNAFNIVTDANGRTYTTTTAFVSVPIGATLNVDPLQTTGSYSGTFTFSAVFQ